MIRLLVIGGGPAGLFAASEAADRGFDVTLMEKGRIGENIRCAEGFFDVLKLLGKPCAGVRYKVDTLVLETNTTYRLDVKHLNLWMIDRSVWQQELGRKAAAKGVKILENRPVSAQELEDLKKSYDYVVDASGAPSVTSRALGFSAFYKQHSPKTIQYVIEGDFSHLHKSFKAGFLPDFWGYYWIFPKGRDEQGRESANVGIGNFNPSSNLNLRKMLDSVLKKEKLDGGNYKIVKVLGGICPAKMPDKLVYGNILLAGDAAGLTSPLHGGGIDMAILSGLTAVRALYRNEPEKYKANLRKLLHWRLRFEGLLAREWSKRDFMQFDKILSLIYNLRLYRLLANPRMINPFTVKFLQILL